MPTTSSRAKDIKILLDLLVFKGLPFSFVEDIYFRRSFSFEACSKKTLLKYVLLTGELVTTLITKALPDSFGLVMDGWSDGGGTHYLAIFASFSKQLTSGGGVENHLPLLSMSPFQDETSFTAANHSEHIEQILSMYGKGMYHFFYFFYLFILFLFLFLFFLLQRHPPLNLSVVTTVT